MDKFWKAAWYLSVHSDSHTWTISETEDGIRGWGNISMPFKTSEDFIEFVFTEIEHRYLLPDDIQFR